MADVYDDGRVKLTEDRVILRHYYFPFANAKRIAYRKVRGVRVVPIGPLTGRGRIWGTGNPRYWLPLDMGRPRRKLAVILDLGRFVRPTFTPDDADQVANEIRQRANLAPTDDPGRAPFV